MSQICGICWSPYIYTDTYLGVNVCIECGAHETVAGWQKREQRVNDRLVPVDRRHRQINGQHTNNVSQRESSIVLGSGAENNLWTTTITSQNWG